MTKRIIIAVIMAIFALPVLAQEKPASTTNSKHKLFNIGIGASSWGVPIYASLESLIKMDNASLAFGLSYQSKEERYEYSWILNEDVRWKHTIIGINGSWNYYVDELLALPDEVDIYAGIGFGYWIWRTKLKDASGGFSEPYAGTGAGGLGASYIIGGRYYIKEKIAVNVQFGGGTILSAGKIGLSFKL